jgi:DNA-binding GntR family transcriptional regulator
MPADPGEPPVVRSSLREQLKDVILGRILSGRYPAGSRLIETRIAQELRVSQTSVREALRDLEHIGCVIYEPYRGCSVRMFSTDELLEAFPVRAALESLAAELAAAHMSDDAIEELEGLYDEMLAAANRGDPHDQSQADARFHAAIAHGAGNVTLERQWSMLEPYARTYITVERSGTDLVALTEQHLTVLDAIRARDGARASEAMHDHLMSAADILETSGAGGS